MVTWLHNLGCWTHCKVCKGQITTLSYWNCYNVVYRLCSNQVDEFEKCQRNEISEISQKEPFSPSKETTKSWGLSFMFCILRTIRGHVACHIWTALSSCLLTCTGHGRTFMRTRASTSLEEEALSKLWVIWRPSSSEAKARSRALKAEELAWLWFLSDVFLNG